VSLNTRPSAASNSTMISITHLPLPSFALSTPTPNSTIADSKVSSSSTVYDLNDDCIGCIGEYLSSQELRNLCQTCNLFHTLPTLHHLWRLHCYNRWNWGKIQKKISCRITRKFDGFSLFPFASPVSDQIIVPSTRFRVSDLMLEYIGPVGRGNRSVRSNQPFPFIKSDYEISFFNSMTSYLHHPLPPSLSMSLSAAASSPPSCRFFSTPYYDSFLQGFQIELRQIAYYEITIMSSSTTSDISSSTPSSLSDEDCVAIGLATDLFSCFNLMPGWNLHSYGYHSDDGAIFHGRGIRKAVYGPKFGIGDIVGCGLRYDQNEIFFTLNGAYLGVAFSNVTGKFYPTVGIDANVQVLFNFGLLPFAFPLHELPRFLD
jgi:hypothetical protein